MSCCVLMFYYARIAGDRCRKKASINARLASNGCPSFAAVLRLHAPHAAGKRLLKCSV